MTQSTLLPVPPMEQWTAEQLYLYHERAAICEFDGGMTREEAEAQALRQAWGRE
jgi:hypothetical protein